jgi:hypothetical protein
MSSDPITLGSDQVPTKYFGRDVFRFTQGSPDELIFNSDLRNIIEPHIAKARMTREEKWKDILLRTGIIVDQQDLDSSQNTKTSHQSITSSAHVPYPSLRKERPFLFDTDTYPLHKILCETLDIESLEDIHSLTVDKKQLLRPLLEDERRKTFHRCYDNFVTSFCIPLLHSLAMTEGLKGFHTSFGSSQHRSSQKSLSNKIGYRYQAFPCIRVIRPGDFSIGPHCDMSYGHSVGNINFHIPLTPTYGTNALYIESYPGREDWHPLKTKSAGLGFCFDGARCLHFTTENTTETTRVSLDFRIAIYRYQENITGKKISSMKSFSSRLDEYISTSVNHNSSMVDMLTEHNKMDRHEEEIDVHDILCSTRLLKDNFSQPGYYEDAYIDLGHSLGKSTTGPIVHKVNHNLMIPDKRVGFPF